MSKPSDSTSGQYADVGKRSTLSTPGNNTASNQQRKPTTPVASASAVKQTVPVKGKVPTPTEAKKTNVNVPTRTSSAPPDEHPSHVEQKPHFQPTKTHNQLHAAATEQSYSKAVKNELKDMNGQVVKTETEDVTSSEPSPTEAPVSDEIPQLEEAVAAVAIDPPVEHQAVVESTEAFEGATEIVADGTDSNADTRDGGSSNSGGYNKYQGDRSYRSNNNTTNNTNGSRPQRQPYNNNNNVRSNNRQNMGGATTGTTAAAVNTNTQAQAQQAQQQQYYVDANGNYYMYYPQYGGYYPVDPRYFAQYQYQQQQQYYYPSAAMYTQYQQQYAAQNPYTMAQQNMSHMQQQTTFQPSATVTQGAAVVTPSKATTTTDEDVAQVASTAPVAVAAVVEEPKEPVVVQKKKLNIKTKDGLAVDIAAFKPQKAAETPVDTPVETAVTDVGSTNAVSSEAANKKEELKISTDVYEIMGPLSTTPLSIPDIPVSVQRLKKVKADVVESIPEPIKEKSETKDAEIVVEATKKDDFVEDSEVNAVASGSQEQASNVASRRLVPGGRVKLNQGPLVKRYTKTEILSLKPSEELFTKSSLLGVISVQGENSAPSTPHGKSGGGSGWTKGQSRGGGGGGGGRDNRENLKVSTDGGNQEGGGWQREAPLPAQQGGRKGKGGPTTPVPKKVVNDPIEVLNQEVLTLLNKITPQTYDKLSKKFLELNIQNTAMLDKLVELIFEIAISQPAFNAMYAELCLLLKEEASQWVFFTVVKNNDANEYFWVRDVVFPEEVVGPFYSKTDCLGAVSGDQCPPLKPSNNALNEIEYVLAKNVLIKVGRNTMSDTWFATYIPFDEISEEKRGQSFFPSENDARKDASSAVSFRGRLAHSCEKEFERSVTENNTYDKLLEELNQLRANRASMSQEDFDQKVSEIEEQRFKIKRRMLGNIRFVGELYKTKLLNTDTMHSCIVELLGQPSQWKPSPDDQDLELLCNLLKTVGDTLESKSRKMKNKTLAQQFDQYFDRLYAISKDKHFSSRIRFGIEEVIALRDNSWQARRVQEGPLKLSEIHQKVQEEQTTKPAARPQSNAPQSNAPQSSSRSILTRTGDARNLPSAKGKEEAKVVSNVPEKNNKDSSKPTKPAAHTTSIPDKIEFTDSSVRRGVGVSLDEYFSGIDVSELKTSLQEGLPLSVGYLIQEVLDKYFNASKGNILSRVLPLFEDAEMASLLLAKAKIVEAAVETYEPIKLLVDTSLDSKEAPERAGAVLSKLIKRGVLQLEKVKTMIEGFKQHNIEQCDYNSPEDIESTFSRFLQALSS